MSLNVDYKPLYINSINYLLKELEFPEFTSDWIGYCIRCSIKINYNPSMPIVMNVFINGISIKTLFILRYFVINEGKELKLREDICYVMIVFMDKGNICLKKI